MTDQDAIQQARQIIAQAERIVAFSGAGLSAESGIATFRDEGGIWERFPPEDFAEVPSLIRTFMTNPDRLREFIAEGVGDAARAEPNAAHLSIAELGQRAEVTVVTQNVDGLHRDAGSATVHELHGSLLRVACTRCGRREDVTREALRDMADRLAEPLPRLGRRTRLIRLLLPMLRRCSSCRARMRPDIVFFGEQLPTDAWQAAHAATGRCDAMLVVGTSAQVYPAALLPMLAHDSGAKVVVVTLEDDFAARWADTVIVGRAATVVPEVLRADA